MNVAVRGDDDVRRAVDASDAEVVSSGSADADLLVAAGESALLSLADDPPGLPVVPVTAYGGPYALSVSSLPDSLDAVLDGAFDTVAHPILTVRVGEERVGRAAMDVSLMTSEAAHISEYAVASDAGRVTAVRADGVVVATPLGSAGYARAAGGPVLAPGTGVSVVPVAPYATETDTWVLRPDVRLTVERDDTAVSLHLDADAVCEVPAGRTVRVHAADELALVGLTAERGASAD